MSLWSLVHLRGRGLLLLVVGCVLLSTALLRWNTILINGVRDESYVFANTSADRSNEIGESEMELPWWDGGPGCPSNYVSSLQRNNQSTDSIAPVEGSCGQRAWAMGPRQRVVAFTLYGDDLTYAKGMEDNIIAIAQLYPGYLVRLYTDTRGKKALLCPLLQKYPILYLCDVTRVPERFGDGLENIHPQMWRFAPMGDPQVQVLLIRDIDSLVNPREVAAVKEWLSSDTIITHNARPPSA
ncbi:unnamed protein product [Meganyctiphanes norvegica]|uniref:Uncharacterized protein n=1 Tax=Meganyctiphanes norvegica TaxID=48144 RepID=A0AAV2PTQ2_MEGNR